jgi:hypothetical protein
MHESTRQDGSMDLVSDRCRELVKTAVDEDFAVHTLGAGDRQVGPIADLAGEG